MNLRRVVTAQDLGLAVRAARHAKGLDQAELAERCGVTRMTISRLERGESVNAATAVTALSECGYELLAAPKFSKVSVR